MQTHKPNNILHLGQVVNNQPKRSPLDTAVKCNEYSVKFEKFEIVHIPQSLRIIIGSVIGRPLSLIINVDNIFDFVHKLQITIMHFNNLRASLHVGHADLPVRFYQLLLYLFYKLSSKSSGIQ